MRFRVVFWSFFIIEGKKCDVFPQNKHMIWHRYHSATRIEPLDQSCFFLQLDCSSTFTDIEEQNNLLHEQIQKLSSQLVDVQSKKSSSPETSPFKLFKSRDPVAMANSAASGDQTDKSSEQLMDVIKFLRREKEISDTKCEVSLHKLRYLVF